MTDPRPSRILSTQEIWRPDWYDLTQVRHPGYLWLDKNENTDLRLCCIVDEIVQQMPASTVSAYPELPPLYSKLSEFLAASPAHLLIANGSDGVIRAAFDAFVDPGDVVIHTSPTYAMYPVYCQLKGADEIAFDYKRDEQMWGIDWDRLVSTVLKVKPKLVCIPNPDSPTGAIIEKDRFLSVLEASKVVGALLIIDEAYFPFHPETLITEALSSDNMLVTRSTGKAWGMAGLRLGFGIASPKVIRSMQTMRSMYECNSVAAYVFSHLIDRYSEVEAAVQRLSESLKWFETELIARQFQVIPPSGNFIHVAFGEREEDISNRMGGRVYYRRKTPHPSLEGFSRFSAANRENFEEIVKIIDSCGQAA